MTSQPLSSMLIGAVLALGLVYASAKSRAREVSHGIEVEPYAFFLGKSIVLSCAVLYFTYLIATYRGLPNVLVIMDECAPAASPAPSDNRKRFAIREREDGANRRDPFVLNRFEKILAMYLEKFKLNGKTAFITGGGQGIGLGCAEALAEAGAKVIIGDRDSKVADDAKAALKAKGFDVETAIMTCERALDHSA